MDWDWTWSIAAAHPPLADVASHAAKEAGNKVRPCRMKWVSGAEISAPLSWKNQDFLSKEARTSIEGNHRHLSQKEIMC